MAYGIWFFSFSLSISLFVHVYRQFHSAPSITGKPPRVVRSAVIAERLRQLSLRRKRVENDISPRWYRFSIRRCRQLHVQRCFFPTAWICTMRTQKKRTTRALLRPCQQTWSLPPELCHPRRLCHIPFISIDNHLLLFPHHHDQRAHQLPKSKGRFVYVWRSLAFTLMSWTLPFDTVE